MLDPKLGINPPYVISNKSLAWEEKLVRHDNIDFHTVRFPPAGKARGKVLLLHGWCEHAGMYYRIMEFLSGLGYESFIYDQRGSGKTSLGKYRGRCGRNAQVVYRDLDRMIEYFCGDGSKMPFYLLGHSQGGGIVLNYLVEGKYTESLAGVVVTGPLIRLVDGVLPQAFVEYVLSLMCYWFPYYPLGSVNRDPAVRSTVTSAPEWIDYLQNELLTQGVSTLSQIKYMVDRGKRLERLQPEEINLNPELKLLILHSQNDTLTSWQHSEMFFNKLQIEDKKFVKLERGSHALFIETQDVFDEVCGHIKEFFDATSHV